MQGAAVDEVSLSSVCRLRGLPFQAAEADIQAFFHGWETSAVHVCKRRGAPCSPTGLAATWILRVLRAVISACLELVLLTITNQH